MYLFAAERTNWVQLISSLMSAELLLFAATIHFAQGTSLTANVELSALPGTNVTYSCTVTGNLLIWMSSAFSNGYIVFIRPRDLVGYTQIDNSFTSVLEDKGTTTLRSSLQFSAAPSLNGTSINCSNNSLLTLPNMTRILLIAGLPMPPGNVSIFNYTLSSVTLQWRAPLFDGLSAVIKYVVGVSTDGKVVLTNASVYATANCFITILSMLYNIPYTFEIRAVNSVGASPTVVSNFTILPEELRAPANLTIATNCDRKSGKFNVTFKWDIPQQGAMTFPVTFVSLNYSTGWNNTIHVRLSPGTSSYTISHALAGVGLLAAVSVFNILGESTNNPTAQKDADCYLSSIAMAVWGTNASIKLEACGIDASNSICVVLYKECSESNADERVSVGHSTSEPLPTYIVNLTGLSPNKTYCYKAAIAFQTSYICQQTKGLFLTSAQQFEESDEYTNDEAVFGSGVYIVAATMVGVFLLGVLATSLVCWCVVKLRPKNPSFDKSTKVVQMPAAVNMLCTKELDHYYLPPTMPPPSPQDEYVHVYDHVFEVSANTAYGNISTEKT